MFVLAPLGLPPSSSRANTVCMLWLAWLGLSQATVLNLVGDGVFMWNLVLWTTVAATASKFELIPTLSYNNAAEQVRSLLG